MSAKRLRILIIGKGALEHALALKLSEDAKVKSIIVVPGNGGTYTGVPKTTNICTIDENDITRILQLSQELKVDIVVPGPAYLIVQGIEACFRAGMSLALDDKEKLMKQLR